MQKRAEAFTIAIENHDQPRALDKWFAEENRNFYSASMLAVLNITLRGIPIIYRGGNRNDKPQLGKHG